MHIPIATYRLQLNRELPLQAVYHFIPFLNQLGVSDLYVSPLTCAEPGSMHGYDITNPTRMNPEITNKQTWQIFSTALTRAAMGLVLDVVPNHMSTSQHNSWWQDVLSHRRASPYADYFDIDWSSSTFYYRRFFDINELVCMRMQNPDAFQLAHQLIFRLIKQKIITGLRIDHIDGLFDPTRYLHQLHDQIAKLSREPCYIVTEKILAYHEHLPSAWPVAGTTGYDFLNAVNNVFIDKMGYQQLVRDYRRMTGQTASWEQLCIQHKKHVIRALFAEETEYLQQLLRNIAKQDPIGRHSAAWQLQRVFIEFSALLPVYRTYVRPTQFTPADRRCLRDTLQRCRRRLGKKFAKTLRFFGNLMLPSSTPNPARLDWVMRWQQYTSPVMAKGFEDTTCYVFNPLLSVNEVGSSVYMARDYGNQHALHDFLYHRQRHTPYGLNATSTHDTKRSEDVRARLNVLSELADEWRSHVLRWQRRTRALKMIVAQQLVPDPITESFLYQSLIGAWPLSVERLQQVMIKAAREAKIHTSWQQPNTAYEAALLHFIDVLLSAPEFMTDFMPLQKKIAFHGALNALSQLVMKLTAPGVPDIYQGCELWNFSLVDPDNRQSIPFAQHAQLLQQLVQQEKTTPTAWLQQLCQQWEDGRIKLWLHYKTLQFRQQYCTLFRDGHYLPITSGGKHRHCVISFMRHYRNYWAIIVAPRFTTRLVTAETLPLGLTTWDNTYLVLPDNAPKQWQAVFSDECVQVIRNRGRTILPVGQVLTQCPVGLLVNNHNL